MRYSSERHVITKLENHQGQEITPDELVADRYFKDNNDKAKPPEDGVTTAATTKTSIEAAKHSSQENNNIAKEEISYEYPSTIKINSQ